MFRYRLILATDMAKHSEHLNEFKTTMEKKFDWLSAEHKESVSSEIISLIGCPLQYMTKCQVEV